MKTMDTIKSKSWVLGLTMLALAGCSKSDNNGGNDNGGTGDRYFIAAASGEYTYTIAVDDIEKDTTITTTTPGTIENLLSFYPIWI